MAPDTERRMMLIGSYAVAILVAASLLAMAASVGR